MVMKLYHPSTVEIRKPDIFRGRKNADFGQGFYLTPDRDFATIWSSKDSVINEYELETDGLDIHRFSRDEEWFDYIYNNRRIKDTLDSEVIVGPIANDTIFDTFGLISSGYLAPGEALKLLLVGPEYTQVVIKSEKAAAQLKWTGVSTPERFDEMVLRHKEEEYLELFAQKMEELQ